MDDGWQVWQTEILTTQMRLKFMTRYTERSVERGTGSVDLITGSRDRATPTTQ